MPLMDNHVINRITSIYGHHQADIIIIISTKTCTGAANSAADNATTVAGFQY